ncbi:MAG: hypothetical protein CR980_01285 [Propionibacteriales bacterium]|nr:MAG: hypothetical protein CR980_01285 [Propionibacteriales bacterium]
MAPSNQVSTLGATPELSSTATAEPSGTTMPAPSTKPSAGKPTSSKKPTQPVEAQVSAECATKKCIALTFDDGPGEQTAKLLDILNSRGAHATFFLLGQNAKRLPDNVKLIANTPGMEIANHSWSHPNLRTRSSQKVKWQLAKTNEVLEQLSGQKVTLHRPPYGSHNKRIDKLVGAQGMSVIMWDVDTLDWKHRNTATNVKKAVSGAKAGNIILMHSIHAPSVAAVPKIVDQLQAKGFTLVTVTELLGPTKPGQTYFNGGGPK